LTFSGGKIEGHGLDPVGRFLIAGRVDHHDIWMIKRYFTHQVEFCGSPEAEGISGEWSIPDFATGPFRVWPIEESEHAWSNHQVAMDREDSRRGKNLGDQQDNE
jgi:hypothetical protein